MGIAINTGFDLASDYEALDSRCLYETVQDMAAALTGIYEGCICYVINGDEKGYYNFHAANDIDPLTGKWRPFQTGGGNCIDDALDSSTTKTYSIDKIKELLNKNGGYVCVDALPNLLDPDEVAKIMVNKIYLTPSTDPQQDNVKEEWICIYTPATQDVFRTPLVTQQSDYDTWKAEITTYTSTGGGALSDDFATYQAANASTTMTADIYAEMIESINASDTDYTGYTSRVSAIKLSSATPESYVWEHFGILGGNLGLQFSTDVIVSNPQGRLKMNQNVNGMAVIDVLEKVITKTVETSVKLVLTPTNKDGVNDKLFEKGVAAIPDVTLNATVDPGRFCTIASNANVIFKKNGVAISTQAYVDGTTAYTFIDTGANIADDTEYSVELAYTIDDDGTSKTAIAKEKYNFTYPIFYGVSATKTVADPTALTKLVEKGGVKELTFTAANAYCVVAVPTGLTVTKILDQNSFNNTSSFDSTSQVVQLGGSTPVNYTIYTNKRAVNCTNFKYKFTIA